MLKLACDAFSKDYFSEHYRALEEADYTVISREDYLKELERLDIEVGKKNNLGEIKSFATVYKGNIIKNLIMDCQSYTKYRPNETTGGIFVSWRRKEELPTGA